MRDEEKRVRIYRGQRMVVIGGLGEVRIDDVVGFLFVD